MAFTVLLIDPNNPSSTIVFTEANFDGLAYADEATGFPAALGAVAKTMEYVGKATSTSSHNFTTGSKTFSIVGGFGFAPGTAVRLADVAGASYMDGLVTACTPNSSLTVNVLSIGAGSGANTSWVITLGTSNSTIVSTPVSEANGGTAAGTFALARTNLEVARHFDVLSVLSTPPGSPANGDAYIIGVSPTGAWAGHEHERALYSSGWVFTTPGNGTNAWDASAKKSYVYTGTAQYTTGIYPGSKWVELTVARPRWRFAGTKSANYTVVAADHNNWWQITTSGSTVTISLTTASAGSGEAADMEVVLEIPSSNGNNVVVQSAGGGNIRLLDNTNAANITVTAGTYALLHMKCGSSGSSNQWYRWR